MSDDRTPARAFTPDDPLPDPLPGAVVALQGSSNFRDLGGHATASGRVLRRGRLFRSAHLAGLTAQDLARLQSLGLTRSVDLRDTTERTARPYALPGVRQLWLPMQPLVSARLHALPPAALARLTADDVRTLMLQTYEDFVLHHGDALAALMAQLLESDAPLVFHCTAGKDRTGLAAALVLRLLGVPHEQVMRDYLLSNRLYRRPALPASPLPDAALHVLWRVEPAFLNHALHIIDSRLGGLAAYAQRVLGLGPAELRRLQDMYLQAAH